MSTATQSSPTPHARPNAHGTELALSRSSSPVASPASSSSHQPNDTGSVLSAAAAAHGVTIVEAPNSFKGLRENSAPTSHHDSPSPSQTVRDGNVQASSDTNTLDRDVGVTPLTGSASSGTDSNKSPQSSNKENASPKTRGSPPIKIAMKRPSEKAAPMTPTNKIFAAATDIGGDKTSSSGKSGSGLKLKLRCIQSALKEPLRDALSFSPHIVGTKRSALLAFADDVDDTDSEIDIMPNRSFPKHSVKHVDTQHIVKHVDTQHIVKHVDTQHISSASSRRSKRTKVADDVVSIKDEDDAMFDAGDEGDSTAEDVGPSFSLLTPALKRNMRILDPSYAPHAQLIANATKAGPEYYDSDAHDAPGNARDTGKPHLFRNVNWGVYATDLTNDADFAKEPEFTQFVPGRFELLPDGTVSDQKAKLVIKLLDKSGRKRVFANPPPRDWDNQEAITALNKRTVQQIRRNTNVRFREVVRAYVPEERRWILANLTAGKPTQGWKVFVEEFNKRFEGKAVAGAKGTRPYRSHSSLTKEVERFGPQFYTKGLVPAPVRKAKKE